MSRLGLIRWMCCCLVALVIFPAAFGQEPSSSFYKERIEPVLKASCLECHSHASGEASGQLMLDSMAAMSGGGSRGPAVVPGKPEESWLLKALTYKDAELQMPPDGKLADNVIEDFRKWIADGAKGAPVGGAVSASGIKRLVPEESQTHWAYRL
ncbi:MAG: c-type cytochrome domain-containing protein, partial [Aureliella sp.]